MASLSDMDRELTVQLARITDPDPLMRADAAKRLAVLPALETVSALLNALNDSEWRVRAAANVSSHVSKARQA